MPRGIDVAKVVTMAGDLKLVNLDITLRQIAGSGLAGAVSAGLDEPWDLICADWYTVIRRGPRLEAQEITTLASSLRKTLGSLEKLGGDIRG
jgi:hypothetical protein